MGEEKRSLFRKESLERLSSPERLDRLMQVVSPKEWLALFALGSLVVVALLWSIFGRIPVIVTGRGVMIYPRRIVELDSPVSGQLQKLRIQVGDCISKGAVLADVDQTELEKQLQQQKNNIAQLQQQDLQLNTLSQERNSLELQSSEKQREDLKQRQQQNREIALQNQESEIAAIQKQRKTLKERLNNTQALTATLAKRLQVRQEIKKIGAISDDVVLQSEQSYRDNLNQIADLEAQIQELNVREAKAAQTYETSKNQLADIAGQLRDLDTKEKTLVQQSLEAKIIRTNNIEEVKRQISQLEVQRKEKSQILAQESGCILEVTAIPGQVVNSGSSLGLMEIKQSTSQMVSLAYFSVKDGKQIKQGMSMQITPETVKREEFGGIVGDVNYVSPYPVSKEAIIKSVGNSEIAQALTFQGGQVEVLGKAKLDPKTYSGYKWSSSQGPEMHISNGTPTSVRVKVDERAPFTFVIPILKSATGVQ